MICYYILTYQRVFFEVNTVVRRSFTGGDGLFLRRVELDTHETLQNIFRRLIDVFCLCMLKKRSNEIFSFKVCISKSHLCVSHKSKFKLDCLEVCSISI